MSVDEKINFLNKDFIYEEGIYDYREIFSNKKYILYRCIESYYKKNPNVEYDKLLQIFYNYIGFGENIEHNMRLFSSIAAFDQQLIDKLTYLMLNNKRINKIEDIENFTINNMSFCDQQYREFKDNLTYYSLKYDDDFVGFDNPIDYLKSLIYIKKYGKDIKFIKEFLSSYDEDIDKLDIPEVTELFNQLRFINNLNDINQLREYYESIEEPSYKDFFGLSNNLSKNFSKIYIDSCYRPSEDNLVNVVNGVEIYEAPDDCFMLIHVLGGFFMNKISLENGYKNDWERRKENFISLSAIGTEFAETCDVKDVCYGFYKFSPNDILGSSIKNLGIHQFTSDSDSFYPLASTSLFGHQRGWDKYCLPHNFLMKSREAYDKNSNIHENEIAYKRFDKNGNAIRPDYIIYFSDSPDELLLEKSIIAAKEFNIPIVMVSKTKWYKYMGEKQNIPQGSISK